MYPNRQLNELAARKLILEARIAVRRWECAAAAEQLARPLTVVDRGISTWHRLSPLVTLLAVPVGWWLAGRFQRRAAPDSTERKKSKVAAVMAALPAILQGVKLVRGLR